LDIFIGNLSPRASESSIRELFEQHGAVERVDMVMNRDTGRPRDYAYVEMADAEAARRAIDALHGAEADGRVLKVTGARARR